MRMSIIFAAVLALGTAQAQAGDRHKRGYIILAPTVVVSCYRGPWKEVIWDRPEPVFIDSLVAAGYDYPTAHAMAERICRDPSVVGNREALRGTAQGIVDTYPPAQRRVARAPIPVYRIPPPVFSAPPKVHGHGAPVMHSTPNGGVFYYYGQ